MATDTPVKFIRDFFGMKLSDMKTEWMGKDEGKTLTAEDKAELLSGLRAFYELEPSERDTVLASPKLPRDMRVNYVLSYEDISDERKALIK